MKIPSTQVGDQLPIGIFDSGVGGLTVLKALRDRLPAERFLYLGDTARLPYGSKSATTVQRYALNATAHLVHHGVKLLVVQPLDKNMQPAGNMQVAVDVVEAGPGDLCVMVRSREAALALPEGFVPVDAAITGIVNEVDLH